MAAHSSTTGTADSTSGSGIDWAAMLDGRLSLHEEDQLVEVAAASALTRPQVLPIHTDYLVAMAHVALEDGVVTGEERSELDRAAACLGLTPRDVDGALQAAACGGGDHDLRTTGIALAPGDRVTFTGEMAVERTLWEERPRPQDSSRPV